MSPLRAPTAPPHHHPSSPRQQIHLSPQWHQQTLTTHSLSPMAPSPLSVVLSAISKQTRLPRNCPPPPTPHTRRPRHLTKKLILLRLISSSIFGGTIFYATTQLPPAESAKVMFGVGVFLGLFFGVRFFRSFKIMPGGVMTVLR